MRTSSACCRTRASSATAPRSRRSSPTRALVALHDDGDTLAALVWSARSETDPPAPGQLGEVPAFTDASKALAKDLKKRGFRFLGPTTVYAGMQACGVVNDHLATCPARAACQRERESVRVEAVEPERDVVGD